jgi:hypothetical protein
MRTRLDSGAISVVLLLGCSVAQPSNDEDPDTGSAAASGASGGSVGETGEQIVCPADGPEGTNDDEILPNIQVQPCHGDLVGLRDLACGHKLTLIDIGAAAVKRK